MSVIAKEIDYIQPTLIAGSYIFDRLNQQNSASGSSLTLAAAGGVEAAFNLNPKVSNLSESILSYVATPTAVAANLNWMFVDVVPHWNSVRCQDSSGAVWLDITGNLNTYHYMITPFVCKYTDLISNDPIATSSGWHTGQLHPNNILTTVTGSTNVWPDGTSAYKPYIEPLHLVGGTINTADPVIQYAIKLKDLVPYSVFSLNQDLPLQNQLQIVFTSAPVNRMGFYGTTYTNPATGATALAAAISLTNLYLYQCVQTNVQVVSDLNKRVVSGDFMVHIDYPRINKQNYASGSANVTARYGPGDGRYLKKLFIAYFNNTETSNTAYESTQASGDDFYSSMNSIRLNANYNFDVSRNEDWMVIKPQLEGSCVLSSLQYKQAFTWCENFCNMLERRGDMELKMPLVKDCGLSLRTGIDLQYVYNVPSLTAQSNFFVAAIFDRVLHITPTGSYLD